MGLHAWVNITFLYKACTVYFTVFLLFGMSWWLLAELGSRSRSVWEKGEGRVRRGVMECSGLERQANWNQGWAVVYTEKPRPLGTFGGRKSKRAAKKVNFVLQQSSYVVQSISVTSMLSLISERKIMRCLIVVCMFNKIHPATPKRCLLHFWLHFAQLSDVQL